MLIKVFVSMRSLVVLLAFTAITLADVSHLSGYNYNRPSGNHVGSGQLQLHTVDVPAATQYHSSYGGQLQPPNSYVPPASGSPFGNNAPQPPVHYAGQTQYSSGRSQANAVSQNLSPPQQQYQTIAQPQQQYQQQNYAPQQSYQQSSYATQQQGQSQSVQQLPPIVTKHFYVHAAPEDPEEKAGPRFVQVGRARKNYKVIFIKAPTYGSSSQIIPILPQNEEKTIVYVLSKKPEFSQNIQLPEPPVTEPSKPEVFFIKYKTQQEAEAAQQKIQSAYENANANLATDSNQQSALFDTNAPVVSGSGISSSLGGQQTGQYTSGAGQQTGQYTSSSGQQTGQYSSGQYNQPQQQSGQYSSGQYQPQQQTGQYSTGSNYASSGSAASSVSNAQPNYLPPSH